MNIRQTLFRTPDNGQSPGLLYQPWVIDGDDCGAVSGMNEGQVKLKYSEKTFSSVTLPTTKPT
jgi:hypothetical protein